MIKKPEERETRIGSRSIEKTVMFQTDGFGVTHLALRQWMADPNSNHRRLDQEILLTQEEMVYLRDFLNQNVPAKRNTEEVDLEDGEIKYLVIETRRVEGKRRLILHWCDTLDEVRSAVREVALHLDNPEDLVRTHILAYTAELDVQEIYRELQESEPIKGDEAV